MIAALEKAVAGFDDYCKQMSLALLGYEVGMAHRRHHERLAERRKPALTPQGRG